MSDLPWREPLVNTYNKPKKRDWETILLVILPLVGLGTLLSFGHLDFPIVEQMKNIPVSFSDFNGSFHFK